MATDPAAQAGPSVFPGATISNRFRIERLLRRGSMGAVWLARHLSLDVDVAVKFIDAALKHEKDHRSRFEMEAQSAARINSPHVVSILDFGEDDGRLYIAMEYLVGEDLGTLLDRGTRLSPEVTARIVTHACRGLERAHALGIAHRDIKPDNLFLCGEAEDDDFVVKILDFGIAKSVQRTPSFTGTHAGQLIGSPAYMSPEQARGLPQIDGRSDLFSLAVVAYHCMTGEPPFSGDSLAELLFSIIGADPEPITRRVPGLPRALDAWFEQALDKDPAKRFATAKEMAQAFCIAVGQHGFSGTDYVNSRAALGRTSAAPPVPSDKVAHFSSGSRVSSSSQHSSANQTSTPAVAPALAQLGDQPQVLGVGLVAPDFTTVAHHSSMGLVPTMYADVAERAKEALSTFDNMDPTPGQALALYFESAAVLLRWVDDFALVVIATEQVHPTVMAVTLNTVATKLLTLAKQAGGASSAFRATLTKERNPTLAATTIAPPEATTVVPDALLAQLTQLFAKPLGAMGRLAVQQRLKAGKPTYQTFAAFIRRLGASIEDEAARVTFLSDGLALVPAGLLAEEPPQPEIQAVPLPAPAPAAAALPLAATTSASPPVPPNKLPAVASPPAPAPPAAASAPAHQPVKQKRFIIYRGTKMEVDD